MEIKITQCHVGQFNLCSSEKMLSFHAAIYHEGKIVQGDDGKIARISYSGTPDELPEFENAWDNFDSIFEKCYKDSVKWFGSTDYRAETMLFARVYLEHYEEINANRLDRRRKEIERELKRLQTELDNISPWPDNLPEIANQCLQEEINKYTKWRNDKITERDQTKEETGKYKKLTEDIEKYQTTIDKYNDMLLPLSGS